MPKIRVVIMRSNGDLDFKKKKCSLNEIKLDWGTVTFQTKHVFGKVRKIFGLIPLFGWKKPYLIIREGDAEPISSGELPAITQKQIDEFCKSKLLRTLGLDVPRETPLIGIITLLVLFAVFIGEILILSGVHVG